MRRAVVGYEVAIVAEGRRARAVPAEPRGRRLFVSAALLVAAALFSVWLSGQYYRIGYAVSAAYEERRALEREQERLRTEILALRNPARIEAIAKGRLGMIDPHMDRMIRVK